MIAPIRTTSTSKTVRKLPDVPKKPTGYRLSPQLIRQQDTPPSEPPPPLPSSSPTMTSCVALYSYQASSSGDLDLL